MARVGTGIRSKSHLSQDNCADCGSNDISWASINRGILICDDCCSVHRSLGRHISHVKSLRNGSWHPSQLAMVHTLNNSGANHVWEHTLLDPSSAKILRRKPQAKDPVHPTKADFIRAKHQMMSFVFRPGKEDSMNDDADADVSCQLHASVRTRNVEISLRLLSQGADPNYFHIEKGNCPLHVAARAGQASQIELLVLYGGDPGGVDQDGKMPVQYAMEAGYHDIATRLIEFQYEVTDRLAFYLCGRKPDHSCGQHWILPEIADSLESSDVAMDARSRLLALPNHSFEELTCDLFDEVDRRETDSIWLSLQNQSALLSDGCSVPFLPVNPEYSSTRNQGRQKLARFNSREFVCLIIDVMVEAHRRVMGYSPSHSKEQVCFDDLSSLSLFVPVSNDSSECFKLTDSLGDIDINRETGGGSCFAENAETNLTLDNPLYASYDEVYLSTDDDREKETCDLDSIVSSKGSDECKQLFYASSSEEEMVGDGCMSDLFSGKWSPILLRSSQKHKHHQRKKKSKRRAFRSPRGESEEELVLPITSRSSTSTNFSMQVSKILGSKSSWTFGDIHPKKLNIVHPPLRCEINPPEAGSNDSSFVRTLTLPLKLATQKRHSVDRTLSQSQPTSPEMIRKNQAPPHVFSRQESSRQFLRSHNKKRSPPCKSLDVHSEMAVTKMKTFNKGNFSSMNSQTATPTFSYRRDSVLPRIPILTLLSDEPVLEACQTCAYNVSKNIQHPSIWACAPTRPSESPRNDGVTDSKDSCKLQ